jgi:hypothetical protein
VIAPDAPPPPEQGTGWSGCSCLASRTHPGQGDGRGCDDQEGERVVDGDGRRYPDAAGENAQAEPSAPEAAGVRVWQIMSRGQGLGAGRSLIRGNVEG